MNRAFEVRTGEAVPRPSLFRAIGLLRNHAAERMNGVAGVGGGLRGERGGVAATGEQQGGAGECGEGERAELYHGLQYLMSIDWSPDIRALHSS